MSNIPQQLRRGLNEKTKFELGGMMCDLQSAMLLLFLGVMWGIFLSGVILK